MGSGKSSQSGNAKKQTLIPGRQAGDVLDRVSEAIIAVDKDWNSTYLNTQAARLFNTQPDELLGKNLWTDFPEGAAPLFDPSYRKALAGQKFMQLETFHEAWSQWYEHRIYPSTDGVSIFLRDITEQKEAEKAAKESSELLHGQNKVLELIAKGEPLSTTLDMLLRIVEEQSPDMLASILLLDEDGVHVRHGAAPSLPESYTSMVDGEPIGPAAGSCGTAAYRGEAVIVEDIASDPLWKDYKDLALKHGLRACWSTPIFDEQRRVLGTFALYFRVPGPPDRRHLKQIEMGTHTASIAIVKHREREALVTAEQRLRLAIAAGNVGIWERDLLTNRLTWSRHLKTILGYPPETESMAFERFLASIHPDDRDRLQNAVNQAIANRTDSNVEYRVVWPDGSTHWIVARGRAEYDAEGKPQRMRGVGLDVTERKKIEEEIKLRETQLRDAQRVAHFGSYEWFPSTDNVRWSDELYRIFGLTRAEFEPTFEGYLERIHPQDRQNTKERIEDCLRDGTAFEIEERILRPDGSTRTLLSQGSWLFDENEQAKKLVGTCQDITARKNAEQARARMEEELRQTHKMESIGRLAGGVAHDFNNLLTVILGHLSVCEEKVDKNGSVHAHLQQISQAAQRAATLTRHLLAFSRRQVIQPSILDLNEVVQNMNKMMMRVMGEHIKLNIVPGKALGSINADLGQVDQILMNLLVNAVDAMPKGGQIFVETSNAELDEEYASRHSGLVAGRYVMLSVTDTGCGMSEETLARIFEPFFTTKPPGEGTGLGLSMVYGAVEQSRGHLTVYSHPGKGTTFKIYFPRVDRAPDKLERLPEEIHLQGSGTILVVEDDESLRRLITGLLTGTGYKVLEAHNGTSALTLAKEYSSEIDLVLTDVVMPEMSGPDLVEQMKAERPGLHVLYMSGYAGKFLSHQGVLDSDTVLLPKPFTKRELLRRVGATLRKAA